MNLNGKLLPFLGALLLGGALSASAALTFEQTVIEDVVSPGAKTYPFKFAFTNTGDAPIEITEVKTSCGCTTAALEQKVYQPGDTGAIGGKFSVGNRRGLQDQKVRVFTKSLAQPEIQLALKLDIPQLVTAEPGLLLWRLGSADESKTVKVSLNSDYFVKVDSVYSKSPNFEVETLLLSERDVSGAFILLVTPTNTALEASGPILISYSTSLSDELLTATLYALVR